MKTNKGNLKTKKELPELPELPEELERYRFVSYRVLEALLDCKRKKIWLDVKEGRFPPPRKSGRNSVAWTLGEVLDYMESLPKVTYSKKVDAIPDEQSTDISEDE